ncbi:MAG: TetR/AcrR family transcriptional regulator [Phycisphaeraceae bacterium]|nr:TetR/AcrR family transcriptional regulator [Phycisphaeraceae bacterium]
MSTAPYLDHTGKRAFELFGGRAEPTTTREKLLEVAIDRFYVHGFHAVGLDQILNEVGVTKTTFYNHFESKDELIIEALKRRDQWEGKAFMDRAAELGGGEPKATILAMFDVFDEWFNHPDYHGCLFLNVCVEFPSPNDPIHKAGTESYQHLTDALEGMTDQAGLSNPRGVAEQITMLMQGALTHRQVSGDNNAAAKARQVAEALIASAIK